MKKRVIYILALLSFCLINAQVSLADNGSPDGGEVTTNGKITFYEDSSISSSSSSSLPKTDVSTPSKSADTKQSSQNSVKSRLPQTGENENLFSMLMLGFVMIFISFLVLAIRRGRLSEK